MSKNKSILGNSTPWVKTVFLTILILCSCIAIIYVNCRAENTVVGPNTLAYANGLIKKITFFQSDGLVIQGKYHQWFSLKNLQTGEIVTPQEIAPAIGEDTPQYTIADLQPGTYRVRSGSVSVYSTNEPINITVETTVFGWIIISLAWLAISTVTFILFFRASVAAHHQ